MKPIFSRKPDVSAVVEDQPNECSPEEKVYQLLQNHPRGMTIYQIKDELPKLGVEPVFAKTVLENLRVAHRVLHLPGDLWMAKS